MWPTLYEQQTAAGPVGVHTYGLFILAAFCSAFIYVHLRATRIGLHPDRLGPVYLAAAVGGLLGGRFLYSVAVEPGLIALIANPLSILNFAGFAYYGGLLGGIGGVFIVATFLGVDRWKLGDVGFSATVLGLGVGRMGCFFAGCCHGAPAPISADPLALLPQGLLGGQLWMSEQFPFLTNEFHGGVGRILDVPLYPTQLWSAVVGVGLWALMAGLWDRRRFDGQWVALVLIIEPIFRFLIETFRADNRGYLVQWEVSGRVASLLPGMANAGDALGDGAQTALIGLTTSQSIGMVMVLVGIGVYITRYNAGVAEEIPVRSDDELDDDEFDDDLYDDE